MRIVERRAKSGIYLTTREASVEALALFARAGVPLDPIQIYETVEIRKIHEIKAAELACERATEENFERLRGILEESEKQLARGRWRARTVIFIWRLFAQLRTAFSTRSAASTTCLASRGCRSISATLIAAVAPHAEHLQNLDALLRRDGNLAQALMSAHLQGAESYWKGLIGTPRPADAHSSEAA